ncbi:MAG TPA: hypothetical protein VF283_00470 [Bryobacteraceae bacterium]
MMKSNHILRGLPVVVFAGAFCLLSPALRAQSQNNTQQQEQQQPTQQNTKYVGTIMKLHNGKYALVTGKTPQGGLAGHFLDDQKDAQKYEGKKVDITGNLNPSSNTIHVTNIHQE